MGGGALYGRQNSQQGEGCQEEIRRRTARKVLWFLNKNNGARVRYYLPSRCPLRGPVSNLQPFGQQVSADGPTDEPHRPYGLVVAAGNHLPASVARLIIEATMSAVCAGHRFEQIAGGVRIRPLVAKLAGIAGFREIAVEQPRRDSIGDDRLH